MQITFDIENFAKKYRGDRDLTNVLSYLKRYDCIGVEQYPSIEKIACRTPSSAYRYCRYFASSGLSPESEVVFLKNPSIGIRYLKLTHKPEFSDPKIQKRFRKKFRTNARLAYEWARAFNTRLSEEEEEVFCKSFYCAKEYAINVIRGRFSEKVHSMIMLASFEDQSSYAKKCLAEYIKFVEKEKQASV